METKFSHSIHTRLKPEELWTELTAAFRDSRGHPFWPTSLERCHAPSLQPGAKVHSTYRTAFGPKQVTYEVVEYQRRLHRFTYHTVRDHPLNGVASLEISAGRNGGSTLRWEGVYRYPWYSPAGLFLRAYFLETFFAELKTNLHRYERRGTKAA